MADDRQDLHPTPPRRPPAGLKTPDLLAVLALAALLRLPTAFFEYVHHNDEVWQYLEPAFRLVTGRSIVTWEFRAGMRSWLMPTALAPAIAAARSFGLGGPTQVIGARLLLGAASLAIVWAGMRLAAQRSRGHAITAGLVLATSLELVYFSTRALADTVGAAAAIAGLVLLATGEAGARRTWLIAGVLLGVAVAARVQLAPALAFGAVAFCWRRRGGEVWWWTCGGGVLGLLVSALPDLAQGATPFAWIAANFRHNLIAGESARFGVEPAGWYVANQARLWSWGALPVLVLALMGARRAPILLAVAIVNVAVHSLIPHKEYRFIFLSVALLLLLAATGTGDLLARVRWRRGEMAGAALLWLGAFAAAATSAAGRAQWRAGQRTVQLGRALHEVPGLCGVALLRPRQWPGIAYVYLDRAVPVSVFTGAGAVAELRAAGASFNAVVAPADARRLVVQDFQLMHCFGPRGHEPAAPPQSCLFVRPGGCDLQPPPDRLLNAVLAARGD